MYVYFIKAWGECPLIKIGKANNPEERIKQLQTGCPFKLNLIGKVRCKNEFHAKQIEKMAHRIFYKQRRRGEWFKLSEKHKAQVASLIHRANAAESEQARDEMEAVELAAVEGAWERDGWERFE